MWLWRGSGEAVARRWRGGGEAVARQWRGGGKAGARKWRGSGEGGEGVARQWRDLAHYATQRRRLSSSNLKITFLSPLPLLLSVQRNQNIASKDPHAIAENANSQRKQKKVNKLMISMTRILAMAMGTQPGHLEMRGDFV